MMPEELEKLIHNIDKKLTHICGDIQHIKEDLKEQKEDIEKLNTKIDDKFDARKKHCFERTLNVETSFGSRPTFGLLIPILIIIVGFISGSYGYTKLLDDRVDKTEYQIVEIKKDCEYNGNGVKNK